MTRKNLFLQLNKSNVRKKALIAYLTLIVYALTILQDKEAYRELQEYANHACPECDAYLERNNYWDISAPQEERFKVLDTEEWKKLSGDAYRRIQNRAFLLGINNIIRYSKFDLRRDEDGINTRELIFILAIASIYIFSAVGIRRIDMSNTESNHPYKDIIAGYIRSQSNLWFIPFLQEIKLSNWKFDADVSLQVRNINEAVKNNIISSGQADQKIKTLRHDINIKEAEYYFLFWQDLTNLKKAVVSGVVSKEEAGTKEEAMLLDFINSRVQII